jgi:hypothetical protein
MGWIDLAQDDDKWWVVVNTAMNFQVNKMIRISWLAEELLASQEGHSSM